MSPQLKLQHGESLARDGATGADADQLAIGKTVIIGLGNRYFSDDGIGILVAEDLQRRGLGEDVIVQTHQTFDLWLLSEYGGASRLVVIDALRSGTAPGTVTEYVVTPLPGPLTSVGGLHSLRLHDLIDFAGRMGLLTCPVTVIGIEPRNCGPGEGVSREVERSIPMVVARVVDKLGLVSQGKAST